MSRRQNDDDEVDEYEGSEREREGEREGGKEREIERRGETEIERESTLKTT